MLHDLRSLLTFRYKNASTFAIGKVSIKYSIHSQFILNSVELMKPSLFCNGPNIYLFEYIDRSVTVITPSFGSLVCLSRVKIAKSCWFYSFWGHKLIWL